MERFVQKLLGLALVIISVFCIVMAGYGVTPEEKDLTVVLLILPLGIGMLFSKEQYVYSIKRRRK